MSGISVFLMLTLAKLLVIATSADYTYLLDESPEIYYSLTLPERKRDSALSKLTASMDEKTFRVIMSKNCGTPLDVTGSLALKDFDKLSTPVQSPTVQRSKLYILSKYCWAWLYLTAFVITYVYPGCGSVESFMRYHFCMCGCAPPESPRHIFDFIKMVPYFLIYPVIMSAFLLLMLVLTVCWKCQDCDRENGTVQATEAQYV